MLQTNSTSPEWCLYTIPYETWNTHRARSTTSLLDTETPEFMQTQLWPANSQIWIQLITVCGKYCKGGVQSTHQWSAAIDDATDEWLPQWRRDPAWPTLCSVAVYVHGDQWRMFCAPSLAVFPHALINWIQIWRILKLQLRWNKFWTFPL